MQYISKQNGQTYTLVRTSRDGKIVLRAADNTEKSVSESTLKRWYKAVAGAPVEKPAATPKAKPVTKESVKSVKKEAEPDFAAVAAGLEGKTVISEGETTFNVHIVTIANVKALKVKAGTTISTIKREQGFRDVKFVNKAGSILNDTDIITEDQTIYITAAKQNG